MTKKLHTTTMIALATLLLSAGAAFADTRDMNADTTQPQQRTAASQKTGEEIQEIDGGRRVAKRISCGNGQTCLVTPIRVRPISSAACHAMAAVLNIFAEIEWACEEGQTD